MPNRSDTASKRRSASTTNANAPTLERTNEQTPPPAEGSLTASTTAAPPDATADATASGVSQPTGPHSAPGRIESHTPGRVRVRVHPSHRDPQILHDVAAQLENQPGVDQVHVNVSTGSVLVHYDHETRAREDIVGCLEDVGLLFGSVLEAGGDEVPDLGGEPASGHSTTAAGLVDTMNDLDRRLSELTGRRVDLKLLFPVALAAVGIRSAFVNGLGLTEVPAYILMWYAFDSFWKFHSRPHSTPGAPGSTSGSVDEAQPEEAPTS